MKGDKPMKKMVAIVFSLLVSSSFALSQLKPRDYYRQGEELLKRNEVYESYLTFSYAAVQEPGNKKFQLKALEVGKLASKWAESKGREQVDINPAEAKLWIQRALSYDKTNASAAEAQALLNKSVEFASEKV